MSDEADDDKQYEASQKKLDDARAKGEVVKSTDLTTAASYAGIVLAVASIGGSSLIGIGSTLKVVMDQADVLSANLFTGSQNPFLGLLISDTILHMLPWFVIPAGLAIISLLGQQAIVFAPDKLQFKLSRISPISGIKNKFGRQGIFEFTKSLTKLLLYGIILGFYLFSKWDRIIATMYLTPAMVMVELGRLATGLMLIVLIVAAMLGIVDYIWQFAEHHRKNRMSRKELMDEMKQSEGDPKLKQERRQKAISIAMNQMLSDVPKSDVVIVNPTHYAVALKWDRTSIGAPVCIAKGVDEIAARIREVATENGIPIHSDPPTARALFAAVDVGSEIAQDQYAVVAAAIRFAEKMRLEASALL
jgi:flagellar biosynthetic protein FlhB